MPIFSEDELNSFAKSVGRGGNTATAVKPTVAPKRSSWLSLVPSVLAAGASLVPGVGTGAAAALGGIGEAGSELLGHQKLSLKNIGEQAALSAVPGGLGKIGKARQVLKGGSEVEKAVKGTEDVAQATSKAKQIPVKYVSSASAGKGVKQTANNLLINPTIGATEDAANSLAKKGYSVSGKVGNTAPTTTPVVKLQGAKTTVKLGEATKPTTEVLPGTGKGVSNATITTNPVQNTAKIEPATPTLTPSLTSRTGSKIRSANRGIQVGTLVPGEGEKVGLTAQQAKDVNNAVDRANTGLRSRTVRGQVEGVQKAKVAQQGVIDKEVSTANRTLTPEELGGIKSSTTSVIDKIPQATTKGADYISEYDRLLNSTKDTKGLNDFIKNMDKEINYGRSAAAPDPVKERVAQAYRDAADKKLVELAPNAKTAKTEWANLNTAEKILTQNKNIEGQGLDVFKIGSTLSGGRGIGGGAFQATKEGLGKALEGAGSSAALPNYGRSLLKQVATRAVAEPVLNSTEPPVASAAPVTPESAPPDTTANTDSLLSTPDATTAPQDQTEQLKQGLQTALVKALSDGDSKGIANIVSVISALDKLAPASTSPSLGKVSAQQNALAKSGQQSLQQLSDLLDKDPSLASKNNTPGQGIPLIGNAVSNLAGASDYHSLADNILSSLIHLQTGATATKEEITSAHGQLPGPEDSPEVRQRKLQTLLSNFEPFLGE